MCIYYMSSNPDSRDLNNAGAKAPNDIEVICDKVGYHQFFFRRFSYKSLYQKMGVMFLLIYQWLEMTMQIPKDAIIIYQHPMHGSKVANKIIPMIQKWRNCKFICIIHDLNSLRPDISENSGRNMKTEYLADHDLLQHMDCLICHNAHMKKWLMEQGIPEEKLICLDIFDYLVDENICNVIFEQSCNGKKVRKGQEKYVDIEKPAIAIAGNLSMGKAGYIYEIQGDGRNNNLQINLYGNGYDESKSTSGMVYKGTYNPNELLKHLEGKFGLVWDGTSAKTCAGGTGEYLRYNNPHKTSLYLAAGIPVIVWKEAAIADFVLKNGVGIAVETLENLDVILQEISQDEYKNMCDNAAMIGQKIRNGEYFSEALKKAVEFLK